ncbi:MAG: proline--tRNA ligase [Candidatus Gracilibacteria bacterium]
MKYSKLFGKTRHTAPHDADSVNARLLTQAGFVEKQSAGVYNFLPLGVRVLKKVNQIIREEMDAVDGQEIIMPVLHSRQVWKDTGRDQTMDDVLYRTKGTDDQEFVLGPSHEEIVTPLVKKYVQSYKDLPLSVYQIQAKFRDEPRAKSGLIRGREFGMKDMYSFHTTDDDLNKYYERAKDAYLRVYERCGLKAYVIEAGGGAFTDKITHEFSVETPAGEDTIILCEKCGTAQNLEIAEGKVEDPDQPKEKEEPMKEVAVKRGFTVAANAKAHDVPEWKILKTVVYEVEGAGLVGVCIRGDLGVNECKLERYFGKKLRAVSPEILRRAGLVQGFISPVNPPKKAGLSFVADHSIKNVKNFVTGANKLDKDLVNVNLARDFTVKDFADFLEVKGSFKCKTCGKTLKEMKAVEAGNIFKLGTRYTDDIGFSVSGPDGKSQPVIMGCYGIGNTRLVGTIVEVSHDEKGIIWPKSVAPYLVHIVSLGADEIVTDAAEKLYKDLAGESVEVLYDDRDESAGVKLNDADLIGIPLRLVVSKRSLEAGGVEWKERKTGSAPKSVKTANVVKEVLKFLKS